MLISVFFILFMRTLFGLKLGFYFSNKSCFSPRARTFLLSSTLLPLLDCGDVFLFGCFQEMFTVFGYCGTAVPSYLILAKNVFLTLLPWIAKSRNKHWLSLIYKLLTGLVPAYLSSCLQSTKSFYNLCSCDVVRLSVCCRVG